MQLWTPLDPINAQSTKYFLKDSGPPGTNEQPKMPHSAHHESHSASTAVTTPIARAATPVRMHVHFDEKDPASNDMPTVVEKKPFHADYEAEEMHRALRTIAKNKVVMDILTSCNSTQRQYIAFAYRTAYQKDLIATIKHELNIMGHYEEAVIALLLPAAEYDAHQLHHALKGPGIDEDCLIEIICSRDNKEITAIRQSYKTLYNKDLEVVIQHDTKGEFEHLLLALLSASRDESSGVDMEKAEQDAKDMYDSEVKHWGNSESIFIRIMAGRSYRQLLATFREFEKLSGDEIEKAIKTHMHGDLRKLMLALAKYITNRHAFFAECLYNSMKGLGTNDSQLIRIVVARCDKDLGNIKMEFVRRYGKTLESFIEGDTSGNYKHILLSLAGAMPHH